MKSSEPLDVVPDYASGPARRHEACRRRKPRRSPRASPPKKATKKAAKKAAKSAARGAGGPSIEPVGDTCPSSHPIKGKRSSKIFHLPGMFAYDRTNPDVCFRDADAAEAAGFRQAKR